MADQPTVIYVAGTLEQAHLLKNRLAEQGIRADVTNETLQRGSGVDYIGWQTAPRVIVDEKDADAARRIALEYDRRGVQRVTEDNEPAEGSPDDETEPVPEDWPQCPQCGAPRLTRCPICKTTGTDFPEADSQYVWGLGLGETPDGEHASCGSCGSCGGHGSATEARDAENSEKEDVDSVGPSDEDVADEEDSPERLVLMCPTCSEPFLPEFSRRCAWCTHEFADGIEPEEIIPPLMESTSRLLVAAIGLLVLTAAVVVYFMYVM
ncbi:MAG TPA: DUF2007 domain-containing protein [Thermoguttaceae bacterium]|nr:DUF2007 domain-containing protein [Thermoguttaceae bacterium]